MVGRSPAVARQLVNRARRRIQEAPTPDRDPSRQRAVVAAFFAAARGGNFEALVAVLDPEIVLRSDFGTLPGSAVVRGPRAVAARALQFADASRITHSALVNGAAGVVIRVIGKPVGHHGLHRGQRQDRFDRSARGPRAHRRPRPGAPHLTPRRGRTLTKPRDTTVQGTASCLLARHRSGRTAADRGVEEREPGLVRDRQVRPPTAPDRLPDRRGPRPHRPWNQSR
jgi:hypothetical protein